MAPNDESVQSGLTDSIIASSKILDGPVGFKSARFDYI